MKNTKMKILSCMLIFVLGLSIVSAQTNAVQTAELTQNAEAQTVGGIGCGVAWGLAIGFAIGTLSPCSILCATAGWFMILTFDDCTSN
jgi:hypothetical protein